MNEFGLQFLQACFGRLPLRQIADKSGEDPPPLRTHFAYGKLHWKRRAVFPFANDDPADPNDAPLACVQVAVDIAIVLGAEGPGLRPGVAKACAELARIPISSEMESLNVSNAAAIAFYEAARNGFPGA